MKVTFVDVFASEKLKGNNAAVCFVDGELDGAWMQALAAELAQPVTAFVDPKTLRLRWFARKAELPLPVSGVVVTARGEEKLDFISRFFCPAHGVGEDPVTGSSHAVVHVRLEGGRAIVGGRCVTLLRGELA